MLYIIPSAITLITAFLLYYIFSPALSIHNPLVYWFLLLLSIVFFVSHLITAYVLIEDRKKGSIASVCMAGLSLVILAAGYISGASFIQGNTLAAQIQPQLTPSDIREYPLTVDNTGILDPGTASAIAKAQFSGRARDLEGLSIAGTTQISYQGAPSLVLWLDFDGGSHRKEGIPLCVTVNMQTGEGAVIEFLQPMYYTPEATFGKDLIRRVRHDFPTALLGEPVFELDDGGAPFFIVPRYKNEAGLFSGQALQSIIIVDAEQGGCVEYAPGDEPTWVDHVYPGSLLLSQYQNYGARNGGRSTSVSSRVLSDNSKTYLYTGIRAKGLSTEQNSGYLLMDLKSGNVFSYEFTSISENAAASAAQKIAAEKLSIPFPSLLIEAGQPTFCLTVTNDTGAAQQYIMVNAINVQIAAAGSTADECRVAYRKLVESNPTDIPAPPPMDASGLEAITGKIIDIRDASIDGYTNYYVRLSQVDMWYRISSKDYESAFQLNSGDTVSLQCQPPDIEHKLADAVVTHVNPGEAWWGDTPSSSAPTSPNSASGQIVDIRKQAHEGETVYYTRLASSSLWYALHIDDVPTAHILTPSDTVVLVPVGEERPGGIIDAKLSSYTAGAPWWG